ncbi:MAG: ATP-binding protein [Cyanosarcina radialis HA8281-LM2]|nr:ATP-binding protein [Cyanosarcina radialis HA8281-LM2]
MISLLPGISPESSWLFPRITPIPLPYLFSRLTNWLQQDWQTGVHNLNQLLQYSLQFVPTTQAVNRVLAETPSDLVIFRLTQLVASPYDWGLIYFTSASLIDNLKLNTLEAFFLLLPSWKQQLKSNLVTELRLDIPYRAAAAGFYCLHQNNPDRATEAFTIVRSLLYGEEMFALSQTLAAFQKAADVDTIARVEVANFSQDNCLRPTTWKNLESLKGVVEDVKLIQRSFYRKTKSLALSRAVGRLTEVINNKSNLPEPEKKLIIKIARTWKTAIEGIAKDIGQIAITQPVTNPYIIGDPVFGNLFVGREDIFRQLEELWVMGKQLQSVVLYGHRRMGKTSILRNLSTQLGAEVKVVYVNLQRLGDVSQGVGEVLIAISDEISNNFQIPPLKDEEFFKLPERTFERYLKTVLTQLNSKGLIIALDEFETIEELINAKKIPDSFIGYLRGLVQMSPKIAFAFAGLHTLEEMTADYFNPFFGSVISIPVSFLQRADTRQILANPSEDFLLDYTPEALDKIFDLTAGQPYLVQLIGFQLVRRYNDYVFERGNSRDATFTAEDVEAIISEPKFFQQGRYYFEGVWGQAAQGATGQQEILRALAPHREGLSTEDLIAATGMGEEDLLLAINTSIRHDVIEKNESRWRIVVELFRRWVEFQG